MQNTLRQAAKFAPAVASFIAGVGIELSGYENFTLAVLLWITAVLLLGIPAWPWIKKVRVGFAPPDAELREAQEAQNRLSKDLVEAQNRLRELSASQEKMRTGNTVRNQRQLEEMRKTEQERDELRAENKRLRAALADAANRPDQRPSNRLPDEQAH